jgi:hypothetical protein
VWQDLNSHDFALLGTNVEIEMNEDGTVVWPTLQSERCSRAVRHVLPSGTTTLAPSPCTDELPKSPAITAAWDVYRAPKDTAHYTCVPGHRFKELW